MRTKKGVIIILAAVVLVPVLATVIFFFGFSAEETGESAPIPFSKLEIGLLPNGNLSFFASIRKEQLLSLVNEGAGFGKVLDIGIKFLPESIDVSGEILCIKADDEERFFKFSKLAVNGYEIPQKLLSGMGEFRLDFERSLSYNR